MVSLVALVSIALAVYVWQANARIARKRPKPGDVAPAFELADQTGARRTSEEFRSAWLVLYFYPRDDTPGCAEQAMRFRNAIREFERLGAVVCGVSVDSSESHAAFAQKYKLPFTLLADRSGEVAARYGSLFKLGPLRFARRNTFLIDPHGTVHAVYVGVNAARNAHDVSETLRQRVAA